MRETRNRPHDRAPGNELSFEVEPELEPEVRPPAGADDPWRSASRQLDDAGWQRLTEIARRNPADAADLAAHFAREQPALAQIVWAAVLDPLAQAREYATATKILDRVAAGEMKNRLIANLVAQWGRDDPWAASEWLVGMSGAAEQTEAFARLGRAWAAVNPQEAADLLCRLPPGELRRQALTATTIAWLEKDPTEAATWLAQREPQADFDLAVSRLTRLPQLLPEHVDVALAWAERVVDATTRVEALASIIVRWADTDRAAALRYVENAPILTAAQRAILRQDLDSERASL